ATEKINCVVADNVPAPKRSDTKFIDLSSVGSLTNSSQSPALAEYPGQCLRSARGGVALTAMMQLDNFDVKGLAQQPTGQLSHLGGHEDAGRSVSGYQHSCVARCLNQDLSLLVGVPGRCDQASLAGAGARLGNLDGNLRSRKINRNIRQRNG